MKQTIFILACAVLMTSCHVVVSSHKEGEQIEVKNSVVSVKPFERVEVAGSFNVHYQQSDSCTLRVQAPEEVLRELDIRNDGNTLSVGFRERVMGIRFGKQFDKVDVFLTSPDLIGVGTAGDVDFKCDGHLDTDKLKLSVAGRGVLDFNTIICDAIKTEIAGSGDVSIKGLTTGDASFEIAGAGDIDVNFVKGGNAEVSIAGSGNVKLSGHVSRYHQSIAGVGHIDRDGLIVSEKQEGE